MSSNKQFTYLFFLFRFSSIFSVACPNILFILESFHCERDTRTQSKSDILNMLPNPIRAFRLKFETNAKIKPQFFTSLLIYDSIAYPFPIIFLASSVHWFRKNIHIIQQQFQRNDEIDTATECKIWLHKSPEKLVAQTSLIFRLHG